MIPAEIRHEVLNFLDEAKSQNGRSGYICRRMGLSMRSVQNWRKNGLVDGRKGSPRRVGNKLSVSERKNVINIACSKRFCDLPPVKIVPVLAEEGRYIASTSTFYRILREKELIVRRPFIPSLNKPVEIKADGPCQLWSWDITYLRTEVRGRFYYLYLVMDVWSRAIMGWEIHSEENRNLSSAMIERLCMESGIERSKLTLHADNGGPMKNATMMGVLQKLGVAESFSRPGVSNDNAFSESLFRTLKYRAGYPSRFHGLEQAREWVVRFVNWYNNEHRHSSIGYVTPMQRHSGKDLKILIIRQKTFEDAKLKHPERWSRHCKQWSRPDKVFLKKGNRKKMIA